MGQVPDQQTGARLCQQQRFRDRHQQPQKLEQESKEEELPHKQALTTLDSTATAPFEEYFTLGQTLGQGAHGTVYRCEVAEKGRTALPWLREGCNYAVKRIAKATTSYAEYFQAITSRESKDDSDVSSEDIQAITLNDSKNFVIQIYGLMMGMPTGLDIIMEALEGPDMFDWMTGLHGTVPEHQVCVLTRQMLSAVHYLHRVTGALHRDVKLENFGFARPVLQGYALPAVKLFDLGSALVLPKPISEKTEYILVESEQHGTLHWMAPEVWDGKCGAPSDVWGIGLACFYMLCDDLPFDLLCYKYPRNVLKALQNNTLVADEKTWAHASESSRNFMQSLLKKEPLLRASTHAALGHLWLQKSEEPPCWYQSEVRS